MAPSRSHIVEPTQQKPKRSLPRIVPAIPLALSRPPHSARPITPDETLPEPTPVTQRELDLDTTAEKELGEQSRGSIPAPLTPESKASGTNQEDDVDRHNGATLPTATNGDPVQSLEQRPPSGQVSAAEEIQSTSANAPSPSTTEPAMTTVTRNQFTITPLADLPPPFYPTTHPPATSTTVAPPQHNPSNPPVHRQQPSLEGIVFGSAQESPGMPSTPQEVDPELPGRQQQLPRQPPNSIPPPQFTSPFYPGHAHHPSDPPPPWMYPVPTAPPDGVYYQGRDYPAPIFPGQLAYSALYSGQFSARRASLAVNGALPSSRSHSQSPSKSHYDGPKHGSDYGDEQRTLPYQNGTQMRTVDAKLEQPLELAAYLSSQFASPQFADYVLRLRSEDSTLLTLPIHGIVVARSPIILSAIRQSPHPTFREKEPPVLDIFVPDKFVTPPSLTEAVKALYGAPLLSPDWFTYDLTPFHSSEPFPPSEALKRMSQAVSYTAAGKALQVYSMESRGIDIVKDLVRWDTFDLALHFSLEEAATYPIQSTTPDQNGNLANQPYLAADNPYVRSLLPFIIDFIASSFPADFSLYTAAPELTRNPRLPDLVEFRPPSHNPRLSKIRFGDVPPEEEFKPNFVTRALSSALLSLPLLLLEQLFNHRAIANRIGWTRVAQIMHEVVSERERRRVKALNGQIRPPRDGPIPKTLLENLYWTESIQESSEHRSGYKLVETRLADHVKGNA